MHLSNNTGISHAHGLDAAYDAWVGIATIAMWADKSITEFWQGGMDKAKDWLRDLYRKNEKEAEQQKMLIQNLLNNENGIKFAPPETKGRWLYILCQTPIARKDLEYNTLHRPGAIMLILSYIQSENEYQTVLKNMVEIHESNLNANATLRHVKKANPLESEQKLLQYAGEIFSDLAQKKPFYRAEAYQYQQATQMNF